MSSRNEVNAYNAAVVARCRARRANAPKSAAESRAVQERLEARAREANAKLEAEFARVAIEAAARAKQRQDEIDAIEARRLDRLAAEHEEGRLTLALLGRNAASRHLAQLAAERRLVRMAAVRRHKS